MIKPLFDQEELQKQSEILKEQKIKQIKDNIRTNCLKVLNLPEEIKNVILDYSFDESKIETNKSLKAKVKEYCMTENEYLISELDVSCVTSMRELFLVKTYLPNSRMFYCNDNKFNQSLDKWNTSNVVDMAYMFYKCYKFNQLVNFDTKNVMNMASMFSGCHNFNQPVEFDTKNVKYMASMFCDCYNFNQPVNFDTPNVINMASMFCNCFEFNQPVNFDTRNVVNVRLMFGGCQNFNQPVNFIISQTVEIHNMFYNCESFQEENNLITIY